MPDRQLPRPRMTTATLRRIVALVLPRTSGYAARTIAAPGLVSAASAERANYRPDI